MADIKDFDNLNNQNQQNDQPKLKITANGDGHLKEIEYTTPANAGGECLRVFDCGGNAKVLTGHTEITPDGEPIPVYFDVKSISIPESAQKNIEEANGLAEQAATMFDAIAQGAGNDFAYQKTDINDLRRTLQVITDSLHEMARTNAVFRSFARSALERLHSNIDDPNDPQQVEKYFKESGLNDALYYLVYVFTETRENEIELLEKDGAKYLTDETNAEIAHICNQYIDFHISQLKDSFSDTIQAFTKSIISGKGNVQTEIQPTDNISMMISKAARRQPSIALAGIDGQSLFVGGNANIQARITDFNGNAITLRAVDTQIQDVIGSIMERTKQTPLKITPAQIWREWKGLPGNATVDQDDIDFINEIMERLMFTPAELDFREHIEKHKNIKHQPDFDYSNPAEAQRRATLITGSKDKIIGRNGEYVEGYTIYDFPMYYFYSHVVRQIRTFPKSLLNPSKKQLNRISSTREKKYSYSSEQKTILQRYLLSRFTGILQDKKAALNDENDQDRQSGKRLKRAAGTILIDEIAADNGFTLTAQTTRTLRQNVETIFDEWSKIKAESGLIKWDIAKTGRKITGWTVTVMETEKRQ